jgi:hypothetical protein
MVKATRKPLEEIFGTVKKYRRVLIVGCGGCTSVCLAGGQRETLALAEDLTECARQAHVPHQFECFTVERQCNFEHLAEIEEKVKNVEAVVSIACGAGVQHCAEAYPSTPVFPGLDTLFVGVDRDVGLYEEACRSCGTCSLAVTGGICCVTRCAKSLFNGPCGGTQADGSCEVGGGVRCAWKDIHDRLTAQGRIAQLAEVRPPMDWKEKGPRTLVQRGYEGRMPAHSGEGKAT